MTLATALSLLNIALGLAGFVLNLRYFVRCRSRWRWIKLTNGLAMLYVAGLYLLVVVGMVLDSDPILFGQMYVRPAITTLLFSLAAGAFFNAPANCAGKDCRTCL